MERKENPRYLEGLEEWAASALAEIRDLPEPKMRASGRMYAALYATGEVSRSPVVWAVIEMHPQPDGTLREHMVVAEWPTREEADLDRRGWAGANPEFYYSVEHRGGAGR